MADTPTNEVGAAGELGRRYDVPPDAVATLAAAIRRGGGQQAQFSHPALGGMGQWSRGGGTMIGDMFNHSLKTKVEQLCDELAQQVDQQKLIEPAGRLSEDWWPGDLGRPASAGSQNGEAYAFFREPRRLAVRDADGIRVYETGDHRIGGVSQRQGSGRDLVFTSQHGLVRLADLDRAEEATSDKPASEPPPRLVPDTRSQETAEPSVDPLALLERLHELQRKGVLSAEEFAAKKSELLARI